jgi:hypothetical protein
MLSSCTPKYGKNRSIIQKNWRGFIENPKLTYNLMTIIIIVVKTIITFHSAMSAVTEQESNFSARPTGGYADAWPTPRGSVCSRNDGFGKEMERGMAKRCALNHK